MFKCCECGAEFKIKPDFCDCGNDSFEEIIEKKQPQKVKQRKTFREQYPGISAFLSTLDPLSVLFFIFCIVLSILALIFIKPNEQNIADEVNQKNIPTTNIKVADIESFWDDTPPVRVQTPDAEEPPQTIADRFIDMLPKQEPQTQPAKVQPKVQQPVKTEPKKPSAPAAQKPVQQKTSVSKPAQNNQKPQTISSKPAQSQVKTQTQSAQKPANQPQKTYQQPVSQQTVQQQPPQQQQVSTQPQQVTQPVVNSAAIQAQAAQEFKNYKNGLRNTIFSKINFANVYGDGSCVVDFQINSNGKLINRKFSKQSTNNTLNDEVYSAIVNTPTYKIPPSSYSGQTLHFSVKFTNGNYEVSLY